MNFKTRFIIASSILLLYASVFAQEKSIKVWPGKVPDAIENASYKPETIYIEGNQPRLLKVVDPTLDMYPAPATSANGTAVIICPGGGYARLASDHEGVAVAQWFNTMGITAFVLSYRLPSDEIMKNKSVGPLQDAQEAVRTVRRHAKEWNIDPEKIGIMGFSAGGHLASTLATHFRETVYTPIDTTSARPNFAILIYPVISMDSLLTHGGSRANLLGEHPSPKQVKKFSNDLQVTADTPPAFLVHAMDDNVVPVQNSINYALALQKYHIPCELHIYEKGGHGFGLGKTNGTESSWPKACQQWLQSRGLLSTSSH